MAQEDKKRDSTQGVPLSQISFLRSKLKYVYVTYDLRDVRPEARSGEGAEEASAEQNER